MIELFADTRGPKLSRIIQYGKVGCQIFDILYYLFDYQ